MCRLPMGQGLAWPSLAESFWDRELQDRQHSDQRITRDFDHVGGLVILRILQGPGSRGKLQVLMCLKTICRKCG